ncbi:hypothetical protein LguiA_002857 [Lonicera macranthoides]
MFVVFRVQINHLAGLKVRLFKFLASIGKLLFNFSHITTCNSFLKSQIEIPLSDLMFVVFRVQINPQVELKV